MEYQISIPNVVLWRGQSFSLASKIIKKNLLIRSCQVKVPIASPCFLNHGWNQFKRKGILYKERYIILAVPIVRRLREAQWLIFHTSSVSPELLHGFARGLAPIAFWRNITLRSINMKVIWRASLLKNCEQANQCNNSGETEEVLNRNFQNLLFSFSLSQSNNYTMRFIETLVKPI